MSSSWAARMSWSRRGARSRSPSSHQRRRRRPPEAPKRKMRRVPPRKVSAMVAMKPMRSSAWMGGGGLLLALCLTYIVRGEATGGGDRPKLPDLPLEAERAVHPDGCDSCQAGDIWKAFVEHMKDIGRGDLVPALPAEE